MGNSCPLVLVLGLENVGNDFCFRTWRLFFKMAKNKCSFLSPNFSKFFNNKRESPDSILISPLG
jgi:hypothetical protein